MADRQKIMKRRAAVRVRAERSDSMYRYCQIIGCSHPARAGSDDGLDRRYCRSHYDHIQRHGDPLKGSYTAAQLAPHRHEALRWLKENAEDRSVREATEGVSRLYREAGPFVEAFRLRGMTPRERAWAAWARLRKADVDPIKPIEAWLAVELTIAADPQPVTKQEFKRVQAAKLVHRMASGSHKRWERTASHPSDPFRQITHVQELHVYPRSRGRVLRHIGEDLENAVEMLVATGFHDLAKAPIRS